MSFLDNIKRVSEQAAEEKETEKKPVNPLLRFKKKTVDASSSEEQKENSNSMLERLRARRAAEKAEAEAEEKEEELKKESIQERAESVVKAVLEKDEKPEEEPEKKSEPVEEKTEDSAKTEEKEETPVEAEKKKEIPAKETAEEEPKKEETESLVKEVENEPTAEEAEPKKRRRRAGRPKGSKNKASKEETEEKEEPKVEAPAEEAIEEEKPSEEVAEEEAPFSYKEAAGEVLSYYIDDEWKEKEKELDKRLSNIRVDGDMNSGTIRFAIGELNRFNDEIRLLCVEQEQLLDILTNKEYGKAPVIASKAKGKNETERKRNAYELMAHYRQPGSDHTINLITLIQAVKLRVTFLRRICGDIDRKSDRCITFQNALKTEASLIQ